MQREDPGIESRPDPDALLKEVEREEAKKGRLKIFLGYAPGVGKTYAMLQEAHVFKERGADVVVGIVETHGRSDTAALLGDLEVMPRHRSVYEGLSVEEMDLDALLARRPEVVLVDELAHTNAPDSRHPKRYLDVEELLGQGIDVFTTVNIQHLESQVDVIARITGITVQETVPDMVLEAADEVQVVDIPLEELSQRLKEGKVYIPEQARRAMENFFQRGNLVALRELTLTLVARKMDSELLNYMRAKAISGPSAGERLMVCVSASPYATQLLRRAYNIAGETHAEWYAVYVHTPSLKDLTDTEKGSLSAALNLAEELGAKAVTLTGTDIANEILRFTREHNISRVVIGKPLRSRLAAFLKGSPVDDLLRVKTDFELHLVTPIASKSGVSAPRHSSAAALHVRPREYAVTVAMVLLVTAVNFLLERFIPPSSLVFVYLIATVAAALFYGTVPSIFASVLSLLAFDFFMTEPRYSFSMYHTSDIVSVVVFFFTSLVVGQLVKTTRVQNQALQLRLKRITLVEEISKEFLKLPPVEQLIGGFAQSTEEWKGILPLLRTTILDDVSHIIIKYISRIVEAPSFVLFTGQDGGLRVWAKSGEEDLDPHNLTVAQWSFINGEMAGAGTETLTDARTCFIPMKSEDHVVGVIGIGKEFKSLLADQRRLLAVISSISALAAMRWAQI